MFQTSGRELRPPSGVEQARLARSSRRQARPSRMSGVRPSSGSGRGGRAGPAAEVAPTVAGAWAPLARAAPSLAPATAVSLLEDVAAACVAVCEAVVADVASAVSSCGAAGGGEGEEVDLRRLVRPSAASIAELQVLTELARGGERTVGPMHPCHDSEEEQRAPSKEAVAAQGVASRATSSADTLEGAEDALLGKEHPQSEQFGKPLRHLDADLLGEVGCESIGRPTDLLGDEQPTYHVEGMCLDLSVVAFNLPAASTAAPTVDVASPHDAPTLPGEPPPLRRGVEPHDGVAQATLRLPGAGAAPARAPASSGHRGLPELLESCIAGLPCAPNAPGELGAPGFLASPAVAASGRGRGRGRGVGAVTPRRDPFASLSPSLSCLVKGA